MDLKRYARYLSMAALLIVMSCSGCSLRPEQSYNKSTIAMDTTIQLRAEGKEAKEAVEASDGYDSSIIWPVPRIRTAM